MGARYWQVPGDGGRINKEATRVLEREREKTLVFLLCDLTKRPAFVYDLSAGAHSNADTRKLALNETNKMGEGRSCDL